jgi:hypothetical protein
MHRMNRLAALVGLLILCAISVAGCPGSTPTPEKKETGIRQGGYMYLSQHQPAHTMQYSPSRETINFWIDTWNKPGKLAYVYMQASNGQLTGYYIFKGLPVSYCAALTPNYDIKDVAGDSEGPKLMVPAPGVDGVYYSGGQCNTYYGRDATTNSYIEYTVGAGQNVLLYERPLPRQNVEPLGFTEVKDVQH